MIQNDPKTISVGGLTGTGTNTGYVAFDNQWCAYRLPCGLCTRTMQQCPKQVPNITYTTTSATTANAGEQLKINL